MVRNRLLKNVKGVSPTISAMLMVVVTVVAMILVISFSQPMIDTRHVQMGERVFIEKVFFTSTQVDIYVRNIGHTDLTLEQVKINGVLYTLPSIVNLPSIEKNVDGGTTTVTVNKAFEEGVYSVSFISSLNKDLGSTEVEYHNSPRIIYSSLIPIVASTINDATPSIEAEVTDATGPDDIDSIYMMLNQEEVVPTSTITDGVVKVIYQVTVPLEDGYYVVFLRVTDKAGNSVSRSWWFAINTLI